MRSTVLTPRKAIEGDQSSQVIATLCVIRSYFDLGENDKAAPRLREGRPWLITYLLVKREARITVDLSDNVYRQHDFAGYSLTSRESRGKMPLLDCAKHCSHQFAVGGR